MNSQFTITEALVESDTPRWINARYDWLERVAAQFEAIAKLPYGWDGDGAPRPEICTLEAAWGLLTSLCRAWDVPKPHVNPTRCGGVQLEWENGARYFEIELVAQRAATYLYRDDDSSEEIVGEIFEQEPLHGILNFIWRVRFGVSRNSLRDAQSALGCVTVEAVA